MLLRSSLLLIIGAASAAAALLLRRPPPRCARLVALLGRDSASSAPQRQWDGHPICNPTQLIGATDLAQRYWAAALASFEDAVVADATTGNGHDTLALARAAAWLATASSAKGAAWRPFCLR